MDEQARFQAEGTGDIQLQRRRKVQVRFVLLCVDISCLCFIHSHAVEISFRGRSMTIGGMMGKKTYSRRYFALTGTSLTYYREIDSDTPAGAVNLIVSKPRRVARSFEV
jgi:hypothetical protein